MSPGIYSNLHNSITFDAACVLNAPIGGPKLSLNRVPTQDSRFLEESTRETLESSVQEEYKNY